MKKNIFFIFLFVVLIPWASAQPPSEINLDYDGEGKKLIVEIRHPTSSTRDHHIQKIFVYKNGEEIYAQGLPTQNRAWGHELEIPIEAKTGDLIRLKAKCNKSGYKESELTIP